jgi:hypothetical protein
MTVTQSPKAGGFQIKIFLTQVVVVVADILLRKKADKSIPVKVKIAGCGF